MDMTEIRDTKLRLDTLMEELYVFVGKSFAEVKPLDGVSSVEGNLRAATVSFSEIMQSKGHIMHPSYYILGIQEEAVRQYLIGDKPSILTLTERLKKLCDAKKLTQKNETIFFNPNIMEHLEQLLKAITGEPV